MRQLSEAAVAFIALYPVCTAAVWIAGGVLFHLFDERHGDVPVPEPWPGVTVLIPAYNEEPVIATTVAAALAADYPELEVLVLDDGSIDGTEAAAVAAAGGDPRCRVLHDPVNRGKAEQLNNGFRQARHDLVVVTDADTHIHPEAIKLLVRRMARSPLIAAVAGAPHVTNRRRFLAAMQILEAAAVIGLTRRTHALSGRVGVVAGVLGLFRRDRVLAVGGYEPRMATEDIDLTWRLVLAGWHTAYEPRALVGMQVPTTLKALWSQRTRWARGQGEVLHVHFASVMRWRNRHIWLLVGEALLSLIWVAGLAVSLLIVILQLVLHGVHHVFGIGIACGVAIAVIATVQLAVALWLERSYDSRALGAFLLGPAYPIFFWLINAAAAVRAELGAFVRGPEEHRVVWDIPREASDTAPTG